ncbi:phage tail protein [Flavobacterium sp. RS13.1]|uniref:phage tail protein n=1 Tax=Flavobacterium sp. RS13.1 TaxID=3400345 RepID=UPI003AAD9A80
MSTEPFIGEIKILAFNFAPRNYMLCAGQLLSISANSALFALLGTNYGGNGIQSFGLPDLRGRVPVSQGSFNQQPYSMGQLAGTPTTTLLSSNMPMHTHPADGITVSEPVAATGGDTDSPVNAFLPKTGTDFYSTVSTPGSHYGFLQASGQTSITGSGSSFSIMNPYLVINYSIAIYGIFPSRN